MNSKQEPRSSIIDPRIKTVKIKLATIKRVSLELSLNPLKAPIAPKIKTTKTNAIFNPFQNFFKNFNLSSSPPHTNILTIKYLTISR